MDRREFDAGAAPRSNFLHLLEEDARKEKERVEYQAAYSEWKNKIITSVVDTAAAMISAAAQTPGPWWVKLIAAAASRIAKGEVKRRTALSSWN